MKTLAEYLRGEQQQRESEKSRCLAELKAALQPYVDVAKRELPAIEAALLEADLWIRENLSACAPSQRVAGKFATHGCLTWRGRGGIPGCFARLSRNSILLPKLMLGDLAPMARKISTEAR